MNIYKLNWQKIGMGILVFVGILGATGVITPEMILWPILVIIRFLAAVVCQIGCDEIQF